MKKLLLGLCAVFICTFAIAHTVEWYVNGNVYQTTTCNSGDNITPPTAPAKYGYTFDKWETYTKLEYIESTGTQYIDTGIKAMSNLNIETTIKMKNYGAIFGSRLIQGNRSTNALWLAALEERTIWLYGNSIQHNWLPVMSLNVWHTIKTTAGSFYLDNELVAEYPLTVIYNGQNMFLFFTNDVNGYEGAIKNVSKGLQISSFKVYDSNDNIIQDLIPVKNPQGEVGMYDTVTGSFLSNQGTGNFIAGPEVQE